MKKKVLMVILELVVFIELDTEAELIVAGLIHKGKGGIALCTDADILEAFAVDGNGSGIIFFLGCVCDHVIPVGHIDFDFMDSGLIEKRRIEQLCIGGIIVFMQFWSNRCIW